MTYDLHGLIWEMTEANRKATEASDAYNEKVAEITKNETRKANARGVTSRVMVKSIIRGVKEKSIYLEELASKQKFFSSEVVRISALLQGILAYDELIKRGFHTSDI